MKRMRSNKWKVAACVAGLALVSATTAIGQGYAGPTLTPSSLSFGSVVVGTSSATQTVSIEAGYGGAIAADKGGTLSITSMTFPAGYARSGGTCPASGAAPNPCTIGVVYTPTLVGAQNGNAVITASVNGQIAGSSNLALVGAGVPGALISVPSLGTLGLLTLLGGLLASGLYLTRRR